MKLIKFKNDPAKLGLPAARREWWDLGETYEVFIHIGKNVCGIGVCSPTGEITYEVAKYLGLNTAKEDIKFGEKSNGRELYLSSGIDCVMLNYTKPKQYRELLGKIEEIVNEHFKK